MATVTSWVGTVTEIGPMYPFVGSEMWMVALVAAFWIAWHVVQLRGETREFEDDAERLRAEDALHKTLEREG